MKKTVFAAQVFGLIAMLPLLVILEMNHVPKQLNTPSAHGITTENTAVTLPGKVTGQFPGESLSVSLVTLLFKTAW
ncbi:MAG: hypothetical protein ABIQ88_11250 [Chitinophagaceae bacterium]